MLLLVVVWFHALDMKVARGGQGPTVVCPIHSATQDRRDRRPTALGSDRHCSQLGTVALLCSPRIWLLLPFNLAALCSSVVESQALPAACLNDAADYAER
jgi:hypothetical protein